MKIIAFIAAILSAATVATLAFTTVPSIQKQAANNAAAIETNAEAIETNAEAIETNAEAIEMLKDIKLYEHHISLNSESVIIYFQFVSQIKTYSANDLIEYFVNNGFTDGDNPIRASGRIYPPTVQSAQAVYGVYVSNDDFYAVHISANNLVVTNSIIPNISISDNAVLLN